MYCGVIGSSTSVAAGRPIRFISISSRRAMRNLCAYQQEELNEVEYNNVGQASTWRCHNPTIFRATDQWFIGMDRNGLRERALTAIKAIKWMPGWGEERISNMIATRPDWCISRQRTWGVPIIVFYCDKCREPLTDRAILDGVVDLIRQYNADIWYQRTAAELIPAGTMCAKCGSTEFTKENDILDVWFDSGSSHLAVLTEKNDLAWPSDLYIEGGDQYRGWFHSSLLVGVGLRNGAPYRECATNGWALDGEGRAMHKSLGNVIAPEDIIKHHGADVLRLWTASVSFNEDVRMSETILTRLERGLSQAAQHLPLHPGQPAWLRSAKSILCPRPKCRRSISGS